MGIRHLVSYSAAPDYASFHITDADELAAMRREIDQFDVDSDALDAAISADAAGDQVMIARDEDGIYFGVLTDTDYRDAAVLLPRTDDTPSGAVEVDDLVCTGCGGDVLIAGPAWDRTGNVYRDAARDWHAVCPGCGVDYVLTERN